MPDYYDQCAQVPPADIAHLTLGDLGDAEREALRSYKLEMIGGDSHCFDLNHRLSHKLTLSPVQQATRDGLDSVFSRCPRVIAPITVYRGECTMDFLGGAAVGDTFICPQYWSTTYIALRTESFTKDGGAILKLELPAGVPAYDIDSLDPGQNAEQELLLARGITWKVWSVRAIPRAEIPKFLARNYKRDIHEVCLLAMMTEEDGATLPRAVPDLVIQK